MNYGFFPDKPSIFEEALKAEEAAEAKKRKEETPRWRPQAMCHRVLVLGPPRSQKVTGRDGKERWRSELLIEADGELYLWEFGMAVFKQLQVIEKDKGLDNVWLEVRKDTHGRFPRIEVLWTEQRA